MTPDICPVTIDELKRQLRITDDAFDMQLEMCLMAASEWCENYSGRKLDSFAELPYQLRAAILMVAGEMFENPTNTVSERTTSAQRLADPLIWQDYTT